MGFGGREREERTTKVRILNEWTDCYQAPVPVVTRKVGNSTQRKRKKKKKKKRVFVFVCVRE